MIERDRMFLTKAKESLAGAESEFINSRFNNCANRAYYAVFQAAIHALLEAGVRPLGAVDHWGHDFVQARCVGDLINTRKRYPADLRAVLEQNFRLRAAGDYGRVTLLTCARPAPCGEPKRSSKLLWKEI